MLVAADAQEFERRFHHALGAIAEAAHDAVGEGAVVHAYAYGRMVLAAEVKEGDELGADAGQFGGILLVGELHFQEFAARVEEVARIDTHLLHV